MSAHQACPGERRDPVRSEMLERYPTVTRVARLPIEGVKRRKVMLLLAAFADEGVRPGLNQLAERAAIGQPHLEPPKLSQVLKRLETDGLVRVHRRSKRR